jgi:hypothetical protein
MNTFPNEERGIAVKKKMNSSRKNDVLIVHIVDRDVHLPEK